MEFAKGPNTAAEGEKRARLARTRLQAKRQDQEAKEREMAQEGLTEDKWWAKYVRCQADVVKFYQLYHPEYPLILAEAIAMRLDGIINKTKAGKALTDEEKAYIIKSKQPPTSWDPMEEIIEHQFDGKLKNAIRKLEEMM